MLTLHEKERRPKWRASGAECRPMAAELHGQDARIAAAGTAVISDLVAIVTRAKVAVKRLLIGAYCGHLIPGWFVAATFRVLRLGVL